MNLGAGLPLNPDDTQPFVFRGDEILHRAEIHAQAELLRQRLEASSFSRIMTLSEDPLDLLRAIAVTRSLGCDLWVAHLTLQPGYIEELIHRFGIQYIIGPEDRPVDHPQPGNPSSGSIHLMTSGTTGLPKVAAHSLPSLLGRIQNQADLASNRAGRWLLTYQPTAFAGLQVILTALYSGGALVLPRQRTIPSFYEAACQHGVTQMSATPTFWRAFLMVASPGTPNLRQITLGGELVDQATLDRLKSAYPSARITHIYASTEAGVVFAVHDGLEGFPASWLDQSLQGIRVRVRNSSLEVLSPNAMAGYLGATPQPLADDGWIQTHDLVEVTADRVRILGRQDSIINVGGAKVYPQAIEAILLAVDGVIETKVYGVPNPITGALVAADVVLAAGLDLETARQTILSFARQRLAPYQVPRILRFVEAIQIEASGKKG